MRTVLRAEIRVERWAIFAEMAFLERRPELGLICRAALDLNDRRIDRGVVHAVLPGVSDVGADNVLAWCRFLGLSDANGSLTQNGEDTAETNDAPVPEQGVYGFWCADHPIMGHRILAVEHRRSDDQFRTDDIKPAPALPDPGVIFRSVANSNERFLVREYPSRAGGPGCIRLKTAAKCSLVWNLNFDTGKNQWQLEGAIEDMNDRLQSMDHEPESADIDLGALATTWGSGPMSSIGRWSTTDRRLLLPLGKVTESEQETFQKTIKLERVEIRGRGTFSDVTIEEVPIGPRTAEDAQAWAMSRLDRRLAREFVYRNRLDVRGLFSELVVGTPLENFAPELPSHERLASRALAAKGRDVFWSLTAPVDLAPDHDSEVDLDSFRIDSQVNRDATASPSGFRLPSGCRWSMSSLVDRLLQGRNPRRVLLCDRYVRGSSNLVNLRLIADILKLAASRVRFDVWTGDEDEDFKRIQSITGTTPRSYRDVFGKSMPHDRYVLVEPEDGESFGWHLSNSPLHALALSQDPGPESPLRWRDLAAMRLGPNELEAPLRQWLLGERR